MRAPVVLVLAALALSACGGDDEDTLDRGALAQRANAICKAYEARATEEINVPKDVSDAEQAAPFFEASADLSSDLVDELDDLKPASAVRDDYESFLTRNREAARLLENIVGAAKDDDGPRSAELLGQIEPISDQVAQSASRFGATACG